MNSKPLVSVIVPTKNSEATIAACLRSIREQCYPNIELIIVDNYSVDRTREIAEKYGKVFLKGPERSAQRNYGASKAAGKYLLFIDSDMELSTKVIEECVEQAKYDQAVKALIIPEISVGEGFWARCKALERSCYIGDDTIEAARFFDREVFARFGGFDQSMSAGEDWDLSQRVRREHRVSRISAIIKHNEGRLRLRDTMRKKYYYAKSISQYIGRHPALARKQLLPFRPAYFRHRRRLAGDPLHTLGFLVMKTYEFGAGALGFVVSRLFVERT